MLELLRDADWTAFAPMRDLPPLRARLANLEKVYGVTEAHRLATSRLRERGMRLRNPKTGWCGSFTDFALSPCGRWLATGRNEDFDEGTLQIWEMATGRVVNANEEIDGGVGWPHRRDTIQWSADGAHIALAFCTNSVGLWNPFGESVDPYGRAAVTDGQDSAPLFALAPDGRRAYVLMYSGHQVMGCITALDQGGVFYTDGSDSESPEPEMLPEPLPDELKRRLDEDEEDDWGFPEDGWAFERVQWSRDGARLLGHNRHGWACAIDVPGGRVRWLTRTDGPAVWSPDQRLIASIRSEGGRTRLLILESETGDRVGKPVEQLPGSLHWGMRGDTARLAVTTKDGHRVDIYDESGHHQCHLDIAVTRRIGMVGWSFYYGRDRPWAWEPSGEHGACLTYDGRIEIWSLGDKPALVRSTAAPEETTAVLWGADGVLATIGECTLRFERALTGDVLGDFVVAEDEEGLGPVEDGEDLTRMFTADTFRLDESTWCATVRPAEGLGAALVIAPEERWADLDTVLAWTVDRRFAWPLRWGGADGLRIVPDADAAAAALQRSVE